MSTSQRQHSSDRLKGEIDALFLELKERGEHTPDLAELLKYNLHLVFVYCNLKRGFPNHEFYMHNATYLGEAHTFENTFRLKETVSFPIIFTAKGDPKPQDRSVLGEVYAMTTHQLMRLDALMGNCSVFEREQRYIVLDEQTMKDGKGTARECWVYMNKAFKEEDAQYSGIVGLRNRHYWQWHST